MPYNSRILAKARANLNEIREANSAEHQRRLEAVYHRVPEIEQIDTKLRVQMVELARLAFLRAFDQNEKIASLKDDNLRLQMRRAELLTENGFPSAWLDEIFSCPICRDSGQIDSGLCSCLKKLYHQELSKEMSSLLHNRDESFSRFDLTLYSSEYSDYFQCIPQEYMGRVFTFCKDYALSFPDVKNDLLFQGEPGLGKSFLATCIAREVLQHGYSVFFDTSVSVFSFFEKQKFSRNQEEAVNAAEKVSQMLTCDLLIIDDLGTEVTTPVVQSGLYTLVDSRITSCKRTILCTTLYSDEIGIRYSSSVCSRLDGYYKTIHFAGTDIRQLQKRG